ncbi:MAG: PHB depolymerase family esterase [Pseudomonadota bacterium]
MARRSRKTPWSRSLQRTLTAFTRTAIRAGSKAMTQVLKAPPRVRAPAAAKRTTRAKPAQKKPSATQWSTGIAGAAAGGRRYRLYKPPGVRRTERLPLLVMLHGCGQDAQGLAASSRMNQIAARERFFVLYPEQSRLAHVQGCWNWYDTRTGRAQGEADAVDAAITQVCLLQAVDPDRIALAGLSAGASLAALLATRRPERFRAVAMHSGVAPGLAHSATTALSAMRGRREAEPLARPVGGPHLPALLVIQGSADSVVAPGNGAEAASLWAVREDAKPGKPRTVQRGARYAATVTDFQTRGRLVATLCMIAGLGHAWSGGAAGKPYSDPKGPDASRMIWAFAAKQFKAAEDAIVPGHATSALLHI